METIRQNAPITDKEFVVREIREFKLSKRRKAMIDGERYYCGQHDILNHKRTIIGVDGKLEEVENLPNNKIVDNQYRKMVNQKKDYLLGQPISIQTDDKQYSKVLKNVLNKRFMRLMLNVAEDSLNGGIGWVFPYYDEQSEFRFKRLRPYECIAGWHDADHTSLDYVIHFYELTAFIGKEEKTIEKVEVFDDGGIWFFECDGSVLNPVEPYHEDYFTITNGDGTAQGFNWSKIPLIPFKYNNKEIPLISMVKSLQDGLNLIKSNFQNQMEEDARNTILVLVNYDGQDLGEFRRNLSTYGAVKVRSIDGTGGDVKTLQVEVNSENYKVILEIFKKAIIENAMGYDAKDDRMAGNPNQMNIQSMYSDIDLDANDMETEYQASIEELLWFINAHLNNTGQGNFDNVPVDVIFNRDILINESEVISNAVTSVGLLSDETIVAQHPWVDDPQKELERVKKQKEENMDNFGFPPMNKGDEDGENKEQDLLEE